MMRKLLVMAMVAGLIGVGGYAKVASAGVTVDLLFVSKNGVGIAPTNAVLGALAGDKYVMNLVMKNDVGLTAHGFSIGYDPSLTPLGRTNWAGIAMNKGNTLYLPLAAAISNVSPGLIGTWQSTNGASSNLLLLPAAGAFAGGYTIGTVGWRVLGPAGADTDIGFLNVGVDGLGGAGFNDITNTALFHGATVNGGFVIPEPATAALLGFGLVGLVLVGRSRRNRA